MVDGPIDASNAEIPVQPRFRSSTALAPGDLETISFNNYGIPIWFCNVAVSGKKSKRMSAIQLTTRHTVKSITVL